MSFVSISVVNFSHTKFVIGAGHQADGTASRIGKLMETTSSRKFSQNVTNMINLRTVLHNFMIFLRQLLAFFLNFEPWIEVFMG